MINPRHQAPPPGEGRSADRQSARKCRTPGCRRVTNNRGGKCRQCLDGHFPPPYSQGGR